MQYLQHKCKYIVFRQKTININTNRHMHMTGQPFIFIVYILTVSSTAFILSMQKLSQMVNNTAFEESFSPLYWYTGADRGFGQGGAPASEAESCRRSEAESRERSEHSAARVQGPLKGPGSFWVFDAQICILTHSRDSFSLIFDIYFDTKSW